MKNPRKNAPALSDRLLKLRFAEKKHGFWAYFRHEVPIFSPAAAGSGGWPSLTMGFRGSCARTSKSDSLLGIKWADG